MEIREKVVKFIRKQKKLAPHAGIIQKLIEKTQDVKSTARDLGEIIKSDLVLSAKILRLVNSPYYGFTRKIANITQAVVLLGFKEIKTIAYQFLSYQLIDFKKSPILQFIWEHSLKTGIIAQDIAKKELLELPEEAFIGGLLHDIGKSILYQIFKDEYLNAMESVEKEREMFEIDHTAVGGLLAKEWFFPAKLYEVCKKHHLSPKSYKEDITLSVACANYIANEQYDKIRELELKKYFKNLKNIEEFVEENNSKWTEEFEKVKAVFETQV